MTSMFESLFATGILCSVLAQFALFSNPSCDSVPKESDTFQSMAARSFKTLSGNVGHLTDYFHLLY